MAKFMVIYNSDTNASDTMAQATPEQMQASMQEWIAWRDNASKTVKVDFGMPLQAVTNITSSGEADSQNKTSGYSMLEGDKAAIIELLKSHPHLKRPSASIDLLEVMPMPGIEG